MEITITVFNDEDDSEVEYTFPAKNEVCDRCEGTGSILNPNIGNHAYSSEEFFEAFPDEEDREQYFKRGGIYDVECYDCKGKNVIKVVDEKRLNKEQKVIYEQYCEQRYQARKDAEDDARTMRMENGGWDY